MCYRQRSLTSSKEKEVSHPLPSRTYVLLLTSSSWLLRAYVLSKICDVKTGVFPGTSLPNHYQFPADDVKTCQAQGKIVTLSLGPGGTGTEPTSEDDALQFVSHRSHSDPILIFPSLWANNLWSLFFRGASSTRPFGDAVLDG